MVKVYVSKADVFKAIERDCGYRGRQHITGWWNYRGDIAFDNNRENWGAEHYTRIDFVAAMCRRVPEVNDAKCNQFGTDYKDGEEVFFFYHDEGATPCHSIREDSPKTERADIRIEWSVDSFVDAFLYKIPQEVLRKMEQCKEYNPHFDLTVLRKVDEKDVPFGQRYLDKPCEYWVIPDVQMKRIEYTMWWRNQFAKIFELDGIGAVRGYMDGALYTETGKRILLGSDAQPDMYTKIPAFAHVGAPSMEETHAVRLS